MQKILKSQTFFATKKNINLPGFFVFCLHFPIQLFSQAMRAVSLPPALVVATFCFGKLYIRFGYYLALLKYLFVFFPRLHRKIKSMDYSQLSSLNYYLSPIAAYYNLK